MQASSSEPNQQPVKQVESAHGIEVGGRSGGSVADPRSLLERGDLALQAIRYRRQAAEYAAAANELEQALVLARQGDIAPLDEWLAKQERVSPVMEVGGIVGSVMKAEALPGGEGLVPMLKLEPNLGNRQVGESPRRRVPSNGTPADQPTVSKPDSSKSESSKSNSSEPESSKPESSKPESSKSESSKSESSKSESSKSDSSKSGAKNTDASKPVSSKSDAKRLVSRPAMAGRNKSGIDISVQEAQAPDSPSPERAEEAERGQGLRSSQSNAESAVLQRDGDSLPEVEVDGERRLELGVWLAEGNHDAKGPSRYSSAMVSGVLHVVLLIAFGAYTIKMIDEPKVMALSSSPMDSESISMVVETPMDLPPAEEESESFSVESQLAPASAEGLNGLVETGEGPVVEAPMMTASMVSSSSLTDSGMGQSLAKAEFFGVKAEGVTFCYLVDKSPSMKRDQAFEMAVSELMRSLESLKPTQRYYIWFFSKELDALTLRGGEPEKFPVSATPENLQRTREWIQTIQIEGGAPPNDALSAAIEMDPDGIFLLFDGDTRVDVVKHLRKVNRVQDLLLGPVVRVPIHTVGFFTQEHESLMRGIAEDNKGTYRFVPAPPKIKRPL